MRITRFNIPLLLLFLLPVNVIASQPDSLYARSFTLGEIEVIGIGEPRRTLPVDRIIDPATRISGGRSVADAMKRLPGVHFNHVGERNESTVYVRGFDVKRVPLFLDGIPIYVPYDGYPDLGRFMVYDISAIIVSKGYSSVLYGPNTMGGAINMVSRKPDGRFEGTAGISYGTGNTRRSYFNVGTRTGMWYMQAGGMYAASDYFRTSERNKNIPGMKRDNSFENDIKASVKVGYTPNRHNEYAVGYSYQSGEKGTPVYLGSHSSMPVRYWQWPEWDKESLYFTTSTRVFGYHRIKTRLYYDTFKNALYSYDDDTYSSMDTRRAFRSYYDDYTYGGSVEMSFDAGSLGTIRTSAHYKRDVHRETQNTDPQLRFNDAIFSAAVELHLPVSNTVSFVGGASIDRLQSLRAEHYDNQADEIVPFPNSSTNAFNPQAGIVVETDNHGKIYATVARKTRLPTMRDRYSFRLGRTIPNPAIAEEQATHYELGYSVLLPKNLFIKSEFYFSDVDDFIMFINVPDPGNPARIVEQNVNIGNLHKYGMDLHAFMQPYPNTDISMAYSYIELDNRTGNDKIINIPRHSLYADISYVLLDDIRLGSTVKMYSRRYSSSDGERIAEGFIVTNLSAEIKIARAFMVTGGINNVFDTPYEYFEGYPQPGRNYFVGLRFIYK